MGSQRGRNADLARRCEDVGWDVKIGGAGHYRVKTHTGQTFSFASTPSDQRSWLNDLAKVRRYGLDELEQKLKLEREKERLQRLEEDRANGVNWESEEEKIEEVKNDEPVLGYAVGGIAILERVPARAAHPRSPGKVVDIKWGVELGLEDGNVIFECIYPVTLNNTSRDCGRQFETANSLRTHISWHTRQVTKNGAVDVGPSVEEIIADREPTIVTTKPVAERIERMEEGESIVVKAEITTQEVHPGIMVRLVELADELDELVDEAAELAESVRVKRGELRKLLVELPQHLADGETKAKARKYDAMMEAAGQ